MNVTQTRSWVERESLNVAREDEKIIAVYSVTMNGDPLDLSERWIGHASENGIAFTYDRCLTSTDENNGSANDESHSSQTKKKDERCKDLYKRGVPMLTLSYRAGPGNRRILITRFQKFKPGEHPANVKGMEYFRKIQQ